MNQQDNVKQKLQDYLAQDIAATKCLVATYRQYNRRMLAVIAILGLLLAIMVCGLWSVHGIMRENASVIRQAIILRSIRSAMRFLPRGEEFQDAKVVALRNVRSNRSNGFFV